MSKHKFAAAVAPSECCCEELDVLEMEFTLRRDSLNSLGDRFWWFNRPAGWIHIQNFQWASRAIIYDLDGSSFQLSDGGSLFLQLRDCYSTWHVFQNARRLGIIK